MCMWFIMVTLTTVGYGDVTPQSELGKPFTMFCCFVGVCLVAGNAARDHRRALRQRRAGALRTLRDVRAGPQSMRETRRTGVRSRLRQGTYQQ